MSFVELPGSIKAIEKVSLDAKDVKQTLTDADAASYPGYTVYVSATNTFYRYKFDGENLVREPIVFIDGTNYATKTELALKANTTDVNTLLAGKSNTGHVHTGVYAAPEDLALKADKSYVDNNFATMEDLNIVAGLDPSDFVSSTDFTALQNTVSTKADASALELKADVDALALKADASALATKADAGHDHSGVYATVAEMSNKADISTVEPKADKTYVDTNFATKDELAGVTGIDPEAWASQEELDDLTDIVATKADAAHDHDSIYAASGHNHDSIYSASGHNHDSTYAASGHLHSPLDINWGGDFNTVTAGQKERLIESHGVSYENVDQSITVSSYENTINLHAVRTVLSFSISASNQYTLNFLTGKRAKGLVHRVDCTITSSSNYFLLNVKDNGTVIKAINYGNSGSPFTYNGKLLFIYDGTKWSFLMNATY